MPVISSMTLPIVCACLFAAAAIPVLVLDLPRGKGDRDLRLNPLTFLFMLWVALAIVRSKTIHPPADLFGRIYFPFMDALLLFHLARGYARLYKRFKPSIPWRYHEMPFSFAVMLGAAALIIHDEALTPLWFPSIEHAASLAILIALLVSLTVLYARLYSRLDRQTAGTTAG